MPLKTETGLFRVFANTKPTRMGVTEFANKYGALGGTCSETLVIGARKAAFVLGETLNSWKSAISRVSSLVELWDAIQQNDPRVLQRWVEWKDNGIVYHSALGAGTAEAHPEWSDRFTRGDLLVPARYVLQHFLNAALREHAATPKLLWTATNGHRRLMLYVAPDSLVSAIWLQFAHAVAGDWTYRTCSACGKWFHAGPGAPMRADAKYCSNACRQRQFRASGKNRRSHAHKTR